MAFKQLHPSLFVAQTKLKGRGVFTTKKILADTVIETAPVIVFNADQRKVLEQTELYNYVFEWGEDLRVRRAWITRRFSTVSKSFI